jgi:hypothetical protein
MDNSLSHQAKLNKRNGFRFRLFLSDRINRMSRIFSRFPDETVKIASACRRKTVDHTFSWDALVYHWYQMKQGMIVVKHSFREADCLFPVSPGNRE